MAMLNNQMVAGVITKQWKTDDVDEQLWTKRVMVRIMIALTAGYLLVPIQGALKVNMNSSNSQSTTMTSQLTYIYIYINNDTIVSPRLVNSVE